MAWTDCEAKGHAHVWGEPHEVRSAYGSETFEPTRVSRQCQVCPVRWLNTREA